MFLVCFPCRLLQDELIDFGMISINFGILSSKAVLELSEIDFGMISINFRILSSKTVLEPPQIHISMQKHYLKWHNLNSKGRSSKLTFDTFL